MLRSCPQLVLCHVAAHLATGRNLWGRSSRKCVWWVTSLLALMSTGCTWMERSVGNPIDQAHRLTAQAEEASDNQDLLRAEKLYEKALQTNPNDGDVHRKLAELMISQGRIPEAIENLNLAAEKSPDDPETQFQLGKLLYEQGELKQAQKSFERTLQIDPVHIEALTLRAEIALKENDESIALATYHRILAASPQNVPARIHLAELQLKQGHPERAAPVLRNICDCNLTSPELKADAYWKLGESYALMRRWSDAADAYLVARQQRAPQNADDWFRVAFANYRAHRWEAAEQAVLAALQLNQSHPHALALATSLKQQTRVQQAAGQRTQTAIRQ